MSLGSLPVELLTNLGGFCGYTQLASLSCVNLTFHAIFNPILYKLNAADAPQKSCLNWAVEHDLLSTLKLAIAHGAKINNTGTEDEDKASIQQLSKNMRSDIVRWLLDNNARLDALAYQLCECGRFQSPRLWYPLHFAICHSNDEILCLLLERGAFYAAKDFSGLCCAVKSGALAAVEIFTGLDSFDPDY
ncbi:hypothetical protein ACHAP5_005525 [Fusarium lateritium]